MTATLIGFRSAKFCPSRSIYRTRSERTSNMRWITSTAASPVVLTACEEPLLKNAMQKKSAGLLLYRQVAGQLEVFLVHPGGPFWKKKDDGAWSIPKGLFAEGEDPLEAAKREFEEETGATVIGPYNSLEPVRQPGGKTVYAWMVRGDLDAASIKSNLFSIEWPPRSGVMREFPEVDKGAWFGIDVARRKILKGQLPFLDQLERSIGVRAGEVAPSNKSSDGRRRSSQRSRSDK